MVNRFYSVFKKEQAHEFDLRNLEVQTWRISDRYGVKGYQRIEQRYVPKTADDYDSEFSIRLKTLKPVTRIPKFLDYHVEFFLSERGNLEKDFLDNIEYVILPKFNEQDNTLRDLVRKWLNSRRNQRVIHYVSLYDYQEFVENQKTKEALTLYDYIHAETTQPFSTDTFHAKLLFTWGRERVYMRRNDTTNEILNDYKNGKIGYFTFDGNFFYKIETMSVGFDDTYEISFKKMEDKQTQSPQSVNISITGSGNIVNLGNIRDSIIHQSQQISEAGQQEIGDILKDFANSITENNRLTDAEKQEALENLEFVTEQAAEPLKIKKPSLLKNALLHLKAVLPFLDQSASASGQNLTTLFPKIQTFFAHIFS